MMDTTSGALLYFGIDDYQFALPVEAVRKVIRAVAVTPVPDAAPLIHGVFDYHGDVVAAVNLRARFALEYKEIGVDDRFLLVTTGERLVALVVDRVDGVKEPEPDDLVSVDVPMISNAQEYGLKPCLLESTGRGLVVIYDLEKLLGNSAALAIQQLIASLNHESDD